MLKKIQLFLLFIILAGILNTAQTQELSRSNKWLSKTIRAKSFKKDSYGYHAFSYMGINNGKQIDQVFVEWQSNLLITVVRTNEEQVTVFVKLFNTKAEGLVHFRDFTIDTLLVPSVMNGTIDLYSGANKVSSAPISTIFNGGYISFDLPEKGEKVRAEFKLSDLEYTREDYEKLTWWGTLINYYYSYSQILEQLVKKVQKENIGRSDEASEIFLTWHEINRVNNYVEKHNFEENLRLSDDDPEGLKDIYKKSIRLQRRYFTLSNELIDSEKKGTISDKQAFCERYVSLSKDYLNKSGNYQPYLASGYYELVRIFSDSIEMKMISDEAAFYDVFNKLGDGSTYQQVYDNFIELASQTYNDGKDVATLDILKNAYLFSNNFGQIQESAQYRVLFTETLETLLGSYLKVAIMSYKAGNFDMADDYAAKALEIFNNSSSELANIHLSPQAFTDFNRQQIDLAKGFLKDKKYTQSIKLLDNAKAIIDLSMNRSETGRLDSAYTIAYTGLYNKMLDSIALLPQMKDTEGKLQALELSQKYAEKHSPYVITDNANANLLASSLFNEFYKNGEDLLVEDKADEALKNLLKAKYINESYFHSNDSELDTLIYNATVPVILDLIKQAEFETWANRMENAEYFYNKAKEMQISYQQENQPKLVLAFDQLNAKMKNRVCVSAQQNLNNKTQIIENRISAGKIDEAWSEYSKLEKFIQESENCRLDKTGLGEILKKHEDLIYFLKEMNQLESLYFSKEYEQLISQFMQLSDFYNQKNLERYSLEKPSLITFINKKSNPELTFAVANYFVSKSEFNKAFDCLQVLKKQHVTAKSTKQIQEKTGEGLAKEIKNDNAETAAIKRITERDDWYKYFRSAFSGGIMGKLLFLTGHN